MYLFMNILSDFQTKNVKNEENPLRLSLDEKYHWEWIVCNSYLHLFLFIRDHFSTANFWNSTKGWQQARNLEGAVRTITPPLQSSYCSN
jgi:hypothetical protein